MKAVSIVLILVGLAAVAAGLGTAPSAAPNPVKLPAVAMRELGAAPPAKEAPAPAAKPAEAPPAPAPDKGKALEKALERTQARPTDELAPPEKTEKAAEPAPAPAPKAAPAPPHAAPAARAPAPAPAAAPAPAPAEPAAEPAPAAVGVLNLRASDTADVYVDGKKAGSSPLLGFKVKAGKHKVRFDCYQASGQTKAGPTQSYDVAADGEKDVEYECPSE